MKTFCGLIKGYLIYAKSDSKIVKLLKVSNDFPQFYFEKKKKKKKQKKKKKK